MKSCNCAHCNVASSRYAWGFALLARDGWAVSGISERAGVLEGSWLCPACSKLQAARPGLVKSAAMPGAGSTRTRPRGMLRVLLIDDEDIVRRCVARCLSDLEVVSVASGLEALELLTTDEDFDAILSDVIMPGMRGSELYEACAERYPQLSDRFVFASGNPESARHELQLVVDRLKTKQAPILLAKPTSRAALLLALFAASAHGMQRSGTYAVVDPESLEARGATA